MPTAIRSEGVAGDVASGGAMGRSIDLTGREYKLLLDPDTFRGAPSDAMAGKLWSRRLKPLIGDSLDARKSGESRAEGELTLAKQRIVTFLDTRKRLLAKHGFALRSRVFVEKDERPGMPEVTLKFRTPDALLAAEFADKGRSTIADWKFEEDIAPLQIAAGSGSERVIVAKPPATYSRFSVSLNLEFDSPLATLGDAFDRFGAFERELEDAKAGPADRDLKLHAGPTICEWVFQNAQVDLGEKLEAEFGFTLWYFVTGGKRRNPCRPAASGALQPDVAEISFDLEADEGRVESGVSRRAMRLFIAMQENLPVNRRAASKTALALPTLQ
jgi:hypothetical protein